MDPFIIPHLLGEYYTRRKFLPTQLLRSPLVLSTEEYKRASLSDFVRLFWWWWCWWWWWWWRIVFVICLTEERSLVLSPARTIVRHPHHSESPTCHEQGLNLHRTRVFNGLLCRSASQQGLACKFLSER